MLKLSKSKGKFFILLVAVIFFYVIILFFSDFNKIISGLNQIDYSLLFLAFPIFFLSMLTSSWRYHLMLSELDIKIKFKESFLIYHTGLSMLITPGGSGELIKSYILKKKINKSISSTTPIVIYEKFYNFFAIIVIIGILLLFTNYVESQIIFVIGITITGFIFLLVRYSIGVNFVNQLLRKTKFTQKFVINSIEFREAGEKLGRTKIFLKLLSISLLSKFILVFVIFIIFKSLSLDFNIFSSAQIFFTSTLMGVLTLIPGGIIVTETGMLGMLVTNDIDFSKASLSVLIIRAVTFWFPIMFGFWALKRFSGIILNEK